MRSRLLLNSSITKYIERRETTNRIFYQNNRKLCVVPTSVKNVLLHGVVKGSERIVRIKKNS